MTASSRPMCDQPGAASNMPTIQQIRSGQRRGSAWSRPTIIDNGAKIMIEGAGTGPIDGFIDALSKHAGMKLTVLDYSEHSLQQGSNAAAICYMEVESDGEKVFGVGINTNIVAASLEALISAVNRKLASD